MKFQVGFQTDTGRKRTQNQDHGSAHPELGLFIVADGMGGHRGGETASATSIETMTQTVRELAQQKNWTPQQIIQKALESANEAVFQKALQNPNLQGMGTTTTALLFQEGRVVIGHVGDSRCYLLRPNSIWQLTCDHSLVQEKLKAGLITRETLRTDPMKNVITRSVGFESKVDVDIYEFTPHPGDCFLLCSDGLSGLVEDLKISEIVQKHFFEKSNLSTSLQETVETLVATANENGGLDNITTLMVQVYPHD